MNPRPKILIVDDREENLLALDALLAKRQFDVAWATSGHAAIQEAHSHKFALIITDMHMPEIDGFELVRHLKTIPLNSDTPIIFATATDRNHAREVQAYEMGVADFIYKPIEPVILQAKINFFIRVFESVRIKEDLSKTKHFLESPSPIAKLYREKDWASHPLGRPESWPTMLKTTVALMLNSEFPMFLTWSHQRYFFYNEAYSTILGKKHPAALGGKFENVWSDIWSDLIPLVQKVDGGESVFLEDMKLITNRKGFDEEAYFTFSYSPIKSVDADVCGLFCAVVETTERKLANDALRESEAQLQVLSDSIPQLVWVTDASGVPIYFNQRWIDFTGMRVGHAEAWTTLLHPDDSLIAKEAWHNAVASGSPYHTEYRLKNTQTGEYRWFRVQGTPHRDAMGKIVRWYGTNTDIEMQKRAQIEFEKNVDVSPAILWITEKDGSCTYLSKQWYEYTGQTPEQALGFGWLDATHPDDKERTGKIYFDANKDQIPFYAEYRLRIKDGTYRWAIDAGNPRYDSKGNYLGYAGTVLDIHDQKTVALESKLQGDAIENSLAGFDIVDSKGQFIYANKAYVKMWGYDSADEILGTSPALHCAHPETPGQIISSLKQTGACDIEFLAKRKDGSTFDVRMLAFLAYDANGNEIYPTTSIDITEQKQARDAVDRALKEAEHANELKSAFLANMSHEIRTPLGAIIGFANLLRDPSLGAQERLKYVDILVRNGENLSTIINDILDLSKVEAGHLILEYEETNPVQIAADVVSFLTVKANEKKLTFTFSSDETTPKHIVSDAVRIRQVLVNLIGNAIKFTQAGSVSIRSYGCRTEKNAPAACFEITDTGIGIPASQTDNVFEMFVQADGSMTRRFGGTGLGLALSRRLARELGGDVQITKTEEGKGTTFLFVVEDQPQRKNAENSVREPARDESQPKAALQGLRILVVDDAPDNQQLIWQFLNKHGAVIDSAENGLVGYNKALAGDYDVVLMDIQMPEMDGHTATQKLRAAGFKKPIIALTAHAMTEMRQKSFDVGCTDHLTKPINAKDLVSAIAAHTLH